MRGWLILGLASLAMLPALPAGAQWAARNHLCDYASLKQGEFDEAHAKCAALTEGRVTLVGDFLTFRFDDGRTRVFTSNTFACEQHDTAACSYFTFRGFVRPSNVYVVQRSCYEFCLDTYLINASNGQEIVLPQLPSISPNGRQFVVTNTSDVDGPDPKFPIVAVYELGLRWLERKFWIVESRKDLNYTSFQAASWTTDDALELDVWVRGPPCGDIQATFKIERVAGSWGVYPASPCGHKVVLAAQPRK